MDYIRLGVSILGCHADVRAFLVAILLAINVTQWLKFEFPASWSDHNHRAVTRGSATLIGTVACFVLWDSHGLPAFIYSLTAGVMSPTVYTVAVRILYWKWNQLNRVFSARPDH